jgi:choloylglycine hydrolase
MRLPHASAMRRFRTAAVLLTSFATVAEAKAALPSILVNRSSQAVFKMPVMLHVTLHDAGGVSLVIENMSAVG